MFQFPGKIQTAKENGQPVRSRLPRVYGSCLFNINN